MEYALKDKVYLKQCKCTKIKLFSSVDLMEVSKGCLICGGRGYVQQKQRPCWYKFTHICCPVCMNETVHKERQYTDKPIDYYKRHEYIERYDACL